MDKEYRYYREVFQGRPMPLAYVDLDRFDHNVRDVLDRAGGMSICVASKSVRCVAMLKRVFEASSQFHAVMCYSPYEAVFLAEQGFDNLLVAYPAWRSVEPSGVCGQLAAGKTITLMVDCEEHLEHLENVGSRHNVTIPACLDVDMSTDFPGLHFGVHRSGVTTPEQAVRLWEVSKACPHVSLEGVMGYEAQIAGLQDKLPGQGAKNAVVGFLKRRSLRQVVQRRAAVVNGLRAAGCELRFVNGGGTGSVETTITEDVVTEVTVGSGFYSPTLFDHYDRFQHLPAAGFAIEIVRRPTEDIYTCSGGGYIASGPAGADRLPKPYLPAGAALLPIEGAGEVQTPIRYRGPENLSYGDPVLLRHSKAGELCERFKSLLLVSDGNIDGEVPTYRGDGQCFL